jgi:hypothetical protein
LRCARGRWTAHARVPHAALIRSVGRERARQKERESEGERARASERERESARTRAREEEKEEEEEEEEDEDEEDEEEEDEEWRSVGARERVSERMAGKLCRRGGDREHESAARMNNMFSPPAPPL